MTWRDKVVPPAAVLERVKPGMSIFLGTGGAEPRTLVKHLIDTDAPNLEDLELIQLVSFGDAVSPERLDPRKFRLKTFFAGGMASEAITAGQVDLIPSRFSAIPSLMERRLLHLDAAFVQVTPPDTRGYCSLGTAVDVAALAIEQSTLAVGEICPDLPVTFGEALIHESEFDAFVDGTEPPFYVERWPVPEVWDRVAANVASVVEDESCLGFSVGPLYEALAKQLAGKRNLGIHSPFMMDCLMDLVTSGVVTNKCKRTFRGKSVVSYALGTPELMRWLDRNPLVEFQGVATVFSPLVIGKNPKTCSVFPARKVGLSGRIVLHTGLGNIAAGPGEAVDFVNGTELSRGGLSVFALPARNLRGESNIRLTVKDYPNQFSLREAVDMVATEFGIAFLRGRTVRERAQALIEVAHPDDRPSLVEQAKQAKIIYQDQIFLPQSAHLYPAEMNTTQVFGEETRVRFRALRPSDEDEMRRLFYRFSDEAVYYRYFSPVKSMPHPKMQQYVNVDYSRAMSVVGLVGEPGAGDIIAEARFVKYHGRPFADVAFVVDENYQGKGIATFLLKMLIRLAQERGLEGFTADVLASNKSMLKVFEKSGLPLQANLQSGVYEITMNFSGLAAGGGDDPPRGRRVSRLPPSGH